MAKIKLIVVDDELTSRNTIKTYLQNDKDYEVVADFSDGKTALEWLRENEADVMLCDMQMSEMNGVELMRFVHLIDEFMPVIAISGFDNFDYVRGSLINGAANYLLKHELTKEGLLDVLNQVRDKYRIEPKEETLCRRTGYRITDKKRFCAEHIQQLVDEQRIAFECSNVVPLAISPDYHFPENVIPSEYKQEIVNAITDILAQIIGQEIPYVVYVSREFHLVLLLSFYNVRSNLYMINTLKNLTSRLQRQIIRMLDLTCTIILGDVHIELEKAVQEGISMEKCLQDKLYLGGNRVVSFAVNNKLTYSSEELPKGLWKQLEFEVSNNVVDEMETVRAVFDFMEEKRFPLERVIEISRRMAKLIYEGESEEAHKIEKRLGQYEIFSDFRGEIMELCYQRKMKMSAKRKAYSALVAQAMDYVEQNYAGDISLENCAQETGSSYTYLSRAFKQETGMRFVEYLNQCRLKKAKSLLLRNELSMKEIVEKVGFRNYNYFFKVFKESEGITPSEFMTQN